ncbi:ATP-binding protein [Vibrio campbellii]|uniref:ATP-binding protein n=1 Tax=Vibrio campbellii TaxID=680 RepID=UPI000687281A|nr:ATP-binding protein [Vibrio campbellii]
MTLRTKTIIGIALIEALALGILIVSGLNWLKSSNEKSLEVGSKQLVSVFAKASRDAVIATDLAYLDSFAQSVVSEHNLAYIRIVDRDGTELTKQGEYTNVDASLKPFDSPNGVYDVISPITLNSQSFGSVEMGVRVDSIHQILDLATQASIMIAILEMTLVALFSFALGSYLMKRLDLLRQGVVKVTQQGPGSQIEISGNDEVTRVGEAFNRMSSSLAKAQNSIKEQYQSQKALSEKVSQLAQVAEHARDAIIITDPVGKITWVNPAFETLTEYSLSEARDKTLSELLQGPNTQNVQLQKFSDSIQNHQPVRTEVLNYTKSNQPYWGERDLSPVMNEHGQVQRFIVVERDISERIEIEKKLSDEVKKSARATKAKSEFLANMSHEIRTPMNAIMGFSEILLESEKRNEQRSLLHLLHKSAGNLITLINDILDYSKVEAGKLTLIEEPFDLRELVESSTALCAYQANKKDLKLLVDMPLDIHAHVIGDRGRINQILLNLIGNAVKFTEEGHILIKITEKRTPQGNVYCFDVIDTGIGIPEERLPHIMDKFEQVDNSITRKYEGTGLGLAISKRLVQMYGGNLSVTSTLGSGSCFSFSLKLYQQTPDHDTDYDLAGINVLLIDSYLPRVTLFKSIAQAMHFNVTHVPNVKALGEANFQETNFKRIIANIQTEEDRALIFKLKPSLTSREMHILFMAPCLLDGTDSNRDEKSEVLHQPITHRKLFNLLYSDPLSSNANQSKPQKDLRGVKLLVAEDSSVNRILISKMLSKTGIDLTIAEDGVIAVEHYQKIKPDMVITDISMPNKDGFSVTEDIRNLQQSQDYPWCPIIAFSAHALEEEQGRSTEVGMNDYLTKPVQKTDLLNMISKWVS